MELCGGASFAVGWDFFIFAVRGLLLWGLRETLEFFVGRRGMGFSRIRWKIFGLALCFLEIEWRIGEGVGIRTVSLRYFK